MAIALLYYEHVPKEIRKKNNGLIGLILQCANLCRTDVKQKCTAFMAKGKCRKF